MTAPTPEQLRSLSHAADNLTRDNEHDAAVIRDVVDALTEASNRIAFLEERIVFLSDHAADKRKEIASMAESRDTWKRLANDERDLTGHLRAMIEKAPHGSSCGCYVGAGGILTGEPCTCWKADAL